MNKTPNETTEKPSQQKAKRRHPYFTEHPKEVMLERMRTFPERAEKFIENLKTARKTGFIQTEEKFMTPTTELQKPIIKTELPGPISREIIASSPTRFR